MDLVNEKQDGNNIKNNAIMDKKAINNVNIKNIGDSIIEISNNEIMIKSHTTNYSFKKPISNIDFLAYSNGNFFIEDKVYMGIGGESFEIDSKDNEIGLKNFYHDLIGIRENKLIRNYQNTTNNNINHDNTPKIHENKTDSKDSTEEIRKYHDLMKDGIISEEEFEKKKKELLKL